MRKDQPSVLIFFLKAVIAMFVVHTLIFIILLFTYSIFDRCCQKSKIEIKYLIVVGFFFLQALGIGFKSHLSLRRTSLLK